MIGQTIRLMVKEGKAAEFEALVAQLMRDVTSNEPGAIYDVRRVRGAPRTYFYFVSFPDQAGFDRYMAADYHTQMSPKALALLDGDPAFEDLDAFD
ncbi:MAG: putative quinol monooxygenase [Pseudomonadales bacterium]